MTNRQDESLISRCWGDGDPLMEAYHDSEWGVPLHDDRKLFEMLLLDNFQAGLSWRTILHKRENFRRAFHGFDPERIAAYADRDHQRLLKDAGIIRNRQKIQAAIANARAFLTVQREFGSFDRYIWQFTDYRTILCQGYDTWEQIPTSTTESDAMSRDLKAHGFRFVGTTTCYAYMQSIGMVDDHLKSCFLFPRNRS